MENEKEDEKNEIENKVILQTILICGFSFNGKTVFEFFIVAVEIKSQLMFGMLDIIEKEHRKMRYTDIFNSVELQWLVFGQDGMIVKGTRIIE